MREFYEVTQQTSGVSSFLIGVAAIVLWVYVVGSILKLFVRKQNGKIKENRRAVIKKNGPLDITVGGEKISLSEIMKANPSNYSPGPRERDLKVADDKENDWLSIIFSRGILQF